MYWKISFNLFLLNKINVLRFERATWHGKTKLLLDERKDTEVCEGDPRKHGVSLSSGDVKLLQNVAYDDAMN